MPDLLLRSPFAGTVRDLATLDDPVFAERIVGDGIALEPGADAAEIVVLAPCDGTVAKLFPGGHGIALETDAGPVLIHIGIDTVELKGTGFTVHVADGATVALGTPLVAVDLAMVRARGFAATTPVLGIGGQRVVPMAPPGAVVAAGDPLVRLEQGR
ncbi:MAG: PTS glucose transporter subunit IIA [Actinomycetota bacterium]